MRIDWTVLTVHPKGICAQALLDEWRWLVDPSLRPIVISSMGDLFLRDETGAVHWLDVGAGVLETIADNVPDFRRQARRFASLDHWFMPRLVHRLHDAGMRLGLNEVYSLIHPAALGGRHEPDNIMPRNLLEHFDTHGQVHAHLRDMAPATGFAAARHAAAV